MSQSSDRTPSAAYSFDTLVVSVVVWGIIILGEAGFIAGAIYGIWFA